MKKIYNVPAIVIEDLKLDNILALQTSDTETDEDFVGSKDRNPSSNYKHEDLGWDY